MQRVPKISDAEWRVMKALWERAPRTANEVVEALRSGTDWSPRTIKTLLSRLLKKGALGHRQEGRRYLYYPKVDEDACVRSESRTFVRRVFDGAAKPAMATLIEQEDLTPQEIAELRRLLDEKERG
jgi:BlaI family penicillinase repressor